MTAATISVTIAELPATLTDAGEDRVRIGQDAVIVLDGASGTDSSVTVSEYIDYLTTSLIHTLDQNPATPLTGVLSTAIARTATALNLRPGRSPSSTVSIVRHSSTSIEVLVLGDSPVYVAHHDTIDRLSDERLSQLDLPSRARLLERLAAGHDYNDHHNKELIRRMPQEKAPHRNRPGGYWIAEADPQAGAKALTWSYPAQDITWCAILTDGADDPRAHLGITIPDLAKMDHDGLHETLRQIHHWESNTDPNAKHLPRFKQHDDKTIAVIRFS